MNDRFGRAQRHGSRPLKRLLGQYPPYQIPYAGRGRELTRAQAETNFAYLLEHRIERLAIGGALLRDFGIDLQAALAAADPQLFLDRLWRWSIDEWPALLEPRLTSMHVWLASRRAGDDIVFSMLMDVAIMLAEMVIVRRSDYAWALDLDPQSAADDMTTWQRPIVVRPADDAVPSIKYDFEDTARTAYVYCTQPTYRLVNKLGGGALDAISGAAEAAWQS